MKGSGRKLKKLWIILGTNAEYIKMAEILSLLSNANLDFILIDTGQHFERTKRLRKLHNLKDPDFIINAAIPTKNKKILWLLKSILIIIFSKKLKKDIKRNHKNYMILHGDTISTLLGLIFAILNKFIVIHIESGLTSRCLWNPFPEELIRRVVSNCSKYLFVPNISNRIFLEKKRKNIIYTPGNTGEDLFWKYHPSNIPHKNDDKILVAIHRFENLLWNIKDIIFILEQLSLKYPVIFIGYSNTLEKIGNKEEGKILLNKLEVIPFVDYSLFQKKLGSSRVVITDGGSIQEECSYIDKPCIVLRKKIERNNGMGISAIRISPKRNKINEIKEFVNACYENASIANFEKLKNRPSLFSVKKIQRILQE